MAKTKWGAACLVFLAVMITASFWLTLKVWTSSIKNDVGIYKSIRNVSKRTNKLYGNYFGLARQDPYQDEKIGRLEKRIKDLEDLNGSKQTYLIRTIVSVKIGNFQSTGIIVSSEDFDGDGDIETYILTAKHVVNHTIKPRPKEQVIFFGYTIEPETLDYILVGMSDKYDLACVLIESDTRVRQPAYLATSLPTKVTKSIIIGFPDPYIFPVVTEGLYSGEYREISNTKERLWHISAPINYGNSGGGAFDLIEGTLIGVVVRFSYANTALIVPVHHVMEFLEEQKVPYHIQLRINFLSP